MLGRLAAKDNHDKRPFKPQIYWGRGQNRNFNQRNYQDRNRLNNSTDRGQFRDRPRSEQNNEEVIFKVTLGGMVDRIAEGNIEITTDVMITREVGIDQGKGHSQGVTVAIELEVQVVVDLGQDPEPVPIGTG